ncbi:MAG: FAD-dependent oxidoreductase [Candidatus Binatia bacterium]
MAVRANVRYGLCLVNTIQERARDTPILAETQVLVVGGGSAGVSAAVASAREGAEVMLVERYGQLGGLATGGLIILLLTLDDGDGHQVIGGLCQELVDRLKRRGATVSPPAAEWNATDPELLRRYAQWGLVWGKGPHRVRYSVAYDGEEAKFVLAGMVEEAKVRLLLHAWACDPLVEDGRVKGVAFQGKSGRFAVLADVVIDATGDGDLYALAGSPFEREKVFPWLWFRMGGVDQVAESIAAKGWFFRTPGEGRVLLPWGAMGRIDRQIDATDPVDLTYAEVECRKMVMEEAERLKRELPGFSRSHVCDIASQLGITESRRLQGEHVLGREEADREFPDAIAVTGNWTKYATTYSIPYRSLLPRELENLLVAGRCISVDHRVHHSTKEIPPCMATGEAAGIAAAMASSHGQSVKTIDVDVLRTKLRGRGAIVDRP